MNICRGNISKGMPVERIGTALQKVVENIEVVKGPAFNDTEID